MSDAVRFALAAVVEGSTLSRQQARDAMTQVMDGEATPSQLAALLVALRMRGETVEELTGFATVMRERVLRVVAPAGAIDVVGTGGDGSGTFNISTAAAIVVAATGVPVAKHGNRAMTSTSGSTDVLEALGVIVEQTPQAAAEALREDGFAFLFAPGFHPAMRHAGPTRREIGVRTAFNLLGPLTNPAGVRRQLLGVADVAVAAVIAAVAHELGTDRTFVVSGDRVDELPLDGSGMIHDVTPGGITRHAVTVGELRQMGLPVVPTEALRGGTPAVNARLIEGLLGGAGGPPRHVVVLNAGAALQVAGRVATLRAGTQLAARTIDSGAAAALLTRLRARRAAVEGAVEAGRA
jgi:anthranilate phosphoribosyltransferase